MTLVVSAVNLVEGGTFTVLRECLEAAVSTLGPDWRIIALVHDSSAVGVAGIEYLEFPNIKSSWARRMKFEFVSSSPLSVDLKADIWLCLHDISASTKTSVQAVYCHNPSPFYRASLREAWQDPVFGLFTLFYGFLYKLNIKRNAWVIVQQEWLRDAFASRYGVSKDRIIVANPVSATASGNRPDRPIRVFVFPTLARPFKNIELIGAALRLLEGNPDWIGEVRVTIDPDAGRYARWLYNQFGDLQTLRFIGRQDRIGMTQLYADADCLIFPSKLETWGLPITEAKLAGLPVIAADLPYAHETVGNYDRAAFVSADDPRQLAATMLKATQGLNPFHATHVDLPDQPFAKDWASLLRMVANYR
jgi:glycosyltransferase involved in cell wall biosynthesis